MGRLRHQAIITLSGNIERRSQSMANAITRMERRATPVLSRMGRVTRMVGNQVERMGNRYTAFVTGATLTAAVKQVGDLDQRVTQLGIDANLSGQQLQNFKQDIKNQVQEAAVSYHTHSGEIFSAIEGIVTRTGDLAFATENINNIATAIRATNSEGAAIGGLMAEFKKIGATDPSAVLELLDALTVQGKQGAFTLKDLSRLGERAFSAYGPQNIEQVKEMGAALQSIRTVTGSSEQATTSFESILNTLGDGKKAKKLARLGIKVFADEGKTQLRPLNKLMQEIVSASGGDITILSRMIEDTTARKALMGVVNEMKKNGTTGELLDKLANVQADGATLQRDAKEASKTFNSAGIAIKEVWQRYADAKLASRLTNLAATLDKMDPNTIDNFTNAVVMATAALIAMSVTAGVIRNGKTIAGGAKGVWDALKGRSAGKAAGRVGVGSALGMGAKPGSRLVRAKLAAKGLLAAGTGSLTSAGAATIAGGAALAGAAGYGIGTLISKAIEGTVVNDAIGKGIAHTLAFFGNDQAQAAIARNQAYEKSLQQSANLNAPENKPGLMRVELDVKNNQARVAELTPPSGLDIETGYTLGAQ